MTTKEQYLQWFAGILVATENMFRLVPPDAVDRKVTPRSFSIGQLLHHIPRSLEFNAVVLRGDPPLAKSLRHILVANRRQPSVGAEEGLRLLERSGAEYLETVRSLDNGMIETGVVDTPQWGTISVWSFLFFIAEHHLNHKEELHINLKASGVDVHTGTLYGTRSSTNVVAH